MIARCIYTAPLGAADDPLAEGFLALFNDSDGTKRMEVWTPRPRGTLRSFLLPKWRRMPDGGLCDEYGRVLRPSGLQGAARRAALGVEELKRMLVSPLPWRRATGVVALSWHLGWAHFDAEPVYMAPSKAKFAYRRWKREEAAGL